MAFNRIPQLSSSWISPLQRKPSPFAPRQRDSGAQQFIKAANEPPARKAPGHSFAGLPLSAAPVQRKTIEPPPHPHISRPIPARAPNRTGLPDRLKAGVERLSEMSLDDVRVHYNSPKPSRLDALAYTQGTEIHVGPGQEQHLAHEAWHVTQQKHGRVQANLQAKGVGINDDAGLEKEADIMGARSEQPSAMPPAGPNEAPASQLTDHFSQLAPPVVQRTNGGGGKKKTNNKKQAKIKAAKEHKKKDAERKAQAAVRDMNRYETPLKNRAKQKAKERAAYDFGKQRKRVGHASGKAGSGKNRNTGKVLEEIRANAEEEEESIEEEEALDLLDEHPEDPPRKDREDDDSGGGGGGGGGLDLPILVY